jgi:hypothetical protein
MLTVRGPHGVYIGGLKVKKLLLLAAILLIPTQAKASICFADAEGVRRHSPDAWVSWTRQMPGHKGDKCYFPTTKVERQWKGTITPAPIHLDPVNPSVFINEVPLPKSRLGYAQVTKESADKYIDIFFTVPKIREFYKITIFDSWAKSLF